MTNSFKLLILSQRILKMGQLLFRKLITGEVDQDYGGLSCTYIRIIGRAIFTNKTNHYGLKWRQDHIRQFVGGGILVIRNPYTAIISFWNYEKTRTHSVFAEKNSFCSVQFREFAFKSISRCRSVTDVYTDRCCRKKWERGH